jgi:hypothetical protein
MKGAECLVRPESHDGQTEGVHGKLIVFHILAKDIGDAGCPSLPLEFGMIRGVAVHLLELDACRIRRLLQVVKDDVLDLHIDVGQRAVFDVVLNAVVPAFLVDNGALHIAIKEVKRLHLITFDGEAVAAEIQFGPAGEVILVLRFLRAILKVPIVDCFRVAYVVDAHDHRVHVGKRSLALIGECSQTDTHTGEHQNRHFQVGIHHQRVAVLLQVTLCGSGNFRGSFRFRPRRLCVHFDLLVVLGRLHRGPYGHHGRAQTPTVSTNTASE